MAGLFPSRCLMARMLLTRSATSTISAGADSPGTATVTTVVANGLSYSYGAHEVLNSVDLQLGDGSMNLLAGRNGAGKSTLLGLLSGIRRLQTGSVELDGRAIAFDAA